MVRGVRKVSAMKPIWLCTREVLVEGVCKGGEYGVPSVFQHRAGASHVAV